ncbi:endonuclease-reverse transcriptase [Elysia marginata]|uniref:Endonuclease-reverse transcriptase n=1 Tax=Elysia marginata TaxID=1093978 RepID=A0AAV4HCV7_9GAST|nr:endonuclease-reverse transcriptase [Elysia marginata]
MKEEGDRRDFYNRLLFFTVVSRGSHIRDNGQDTRTVSALRRQKEKATHWPALCHKLNMKTNNKERSDSPAPLETPGGELDYKMTGEGESSRRGNDPDDGNMPECGRGQSNCRGSSFNKKRKKKKRKLINIGTWNARTLTSIGKLHLLLQELTECNMNITGLCETRWSGEGHCSSGERTIIHSGKEKDGESGVAIVLDKTHAGCMKSYNPVSDRI